MTGYSFTARSTPWKLHSGQRSIEDRLRSEVERSGATRAFVITSPSIAGRTNTVERVERALGETHAGTFSEIANDATYASVAAATDAARAANADLLVAVGGGSVIVAARAVDIFLCENGDPFELMTQYPADGKAHSPRLDAPKLPIVNVVTTPTSAMNRAGTGLKNLELDHRMEYFDPKTRPAAIIWDWEALSATPFVVLRSAATTTFLSAYETSLGATTNPLLDADRSHAFARARRAFMDLANDPDGLIPRLDLCAAALLMNRAEDDHIGPLLPTTGGFSTGDYALATAIHVRYPWIGQGEATAALAAASVRRSPTAPEDFVRHAAQMLGCWREGMSAAEGQETVAATLESLLRGVGMPTRVAELGLPDGDIPAIAAETVRNFNANPGARSPEQQIAAAAALLRAAW